jgi:hypothetical protein
MTMTCIILCLVAFLVGGSGGVLVASLLCGSRP